MSFKFGFIGCGNMGGALAIAISKKIGGENILLCDACEEKVAELASKTGGRPCDLAGIASESDFIFLGVKPQGFAGLFSDLSPLLKKRGAGFTLVTMAAGLSISAVKDLAGMDCPIIRIMPNTPVSVGKGMILYTLGEGVTEEICSTFRSALSEAGCLDLIEEGKIDAASALSGCGPAYVCMFIEALADGAVECGIARDKAMLYAAQTLIGTAELLLATGKHPGALKDAVCSPGGTTIAGVHALEEGGFRASAINAVNAAYERTLELKK